MAPKGKQRSMTRGRGFLSVFVFLVFCHAPFFAQDEARIRGELVDWHWAKTKHELAVLYRDPGGSFRVKVIAASGVQTRAELDLSRFGFERVTCFDWLEDDSGFLLAAELKTDHPELFIHDFASGQVNAAVYGPESGSAVAALAIDRTGERWAETGWREGVLSLVVWNSRHERILFAAANLMEIKLVKMEGCFLYLFTDMPLDRCGQLVRRDGVVNLGLLGDSEPAAVMVNDGRFGPAEDFLTDRPAVYEVNLEKLSIMKTALDAEALQNVSFDGTFRAGVVGTADADDYRVRWIAVRIFRND